jgi:hypothetical protein
VKDIINLLRENDPELQIMTKNLLMCGRNKIWRVTVLRRALEIRIIYVNTIFELVEDISSLLFSSLE